MAAARERKEQRMFERVTYRAGVHVRFDGSSDWSAGEIRDISLGGAFVAGLAAPFGTRLVLRIAIPGALEPVELPGVVRWARADGIGIQFALLGARETHLIVVLVGARRGTSGGRD